MPLQKNQILTLRIERLSSDGSGVAHSADGEAVFVPGTAPGDEARAFWTSCSLPRRIVFRWTARWQVPAAGAACGIWPTLPSCAPSRKACWTPSAASADWRFRCWISCPPRR